MSPAKKASADLVYYLFTRECYETYVDKHDFLNIPCLKMLVSKALGYAIIAGSFILKLPQILIIISAKDVTGLNPSAFYLEVLTFQAGCAYNLLRGYPIDTWGENAVILIQNMILVMLLWTYSNVSLVQKLVSIAAFVSLGAAMFQLPTEIQWILPSASIPMSIMARMPQV
jgi:mannose-P-dolichol utilization defect protein 1